MFLGDHLQRFGGFLHQHQDPDPRNRALGLGLLRIRLGLGDTHIRLALVDTKLAAFAGELAAGLQNDMVV